MNYCCIVARYAAIWYLFFVIYGDIQVAFVQEVKYFGIVNIVLCIEEPTSIFPNMKWKYGDKLILCANEIVW